MLAGFVALLPRQELLKAAGVNVEVKVTRDVTLRTARGLPELRLTFSNVSLGGRCWSKVVVVASIAHQG